MTALSVGRRIDVHSAFGVNQSGKSDRPWREGEGEVDDKYASTNREIAGP